MSYGIAVDGVLVAHGVNIPILFNYGSKYILFRLNLNNICVFHGLSLGLWHDSGSTFNAYSHNLLQISHLE